MSDFAELQKSARASEPLTLAGSRSFAIAYACGSSALIALGLVTLPFNPFLIFGAAVAFVAVFCMAVVTVTPGATYLEIDGDGITRCLMFRKRSVSWENVTAIRADWFVSATFPVSWNRQVFLQSRRDAHEGLSFFPHQFGLNDEQAVDLLTPYFENARRKPPVPQNEAVAA
jgi:hypothetical protein